MHCEIVGVQHYDGEKPTNWIYRGFHLGIVACSAEGSAFFYYDTAARGSQRDTV
jgi:hypothetical protein